MIIDFHHHLLSGKSYTDELIRSMDAAGIETACISGLGIGRGRQTAGDYDKFSLGGLEPDNEDVLRAVEKYPGRLIGLGVLNLDADTPDTVSRLRGQGFRGLKVTRPRKPYNSDAYMPLYERADNERLPILFHTGMVLTTPFDAADDVCSDRMRPMLLDRVARRFPNLRIVMAHMGYPWFDEAAAMLRFHEHVYADLTASERGWRAYWAPSDFQRLLFWKDAFQKLIFGTDVRAGDVGASLRDQAKLLELLGVDEKTRERFFHGNAEELLHLTASE